MDIIITAFIVIIIGSVFIAFFLPSIVALLIAVMKVLYIFTLYVLQFTLWILKAIVVMIAFPFAAISQFLKKDPPQQP